MSTRASSLQATNLLAINREIDSKYDAVLAVRDKLTEIELVAGLDIEQILVDLQEAQDFTGSAVSSLSSSGYQKLPSGLIIQWGTSSAASGTSFLTLPMAFPNNGLSAVASFQIPADGNINIAVYYTTQLYIQNTYSGPQVFNWIAIGF